jgi:hypothetical protein
MAREWRILIGAIRLPHHRRAGMISGFFIAEAGHRSGFFFSRISAPFHCARKCHEMDRCGN